MSARHRISVMALRAAPPPSAPFEQIFRREASWAPPSTATPSTGTPRRDGRSHQGSGRSGQSSLQPFGPEQPLRGTRRGVRRVRGARHRSHPPLRARRGRGRAVRDASRHLQHLGGVRSDTDVLFYEGLHGAVVTDTADIARHVDLKIGVSRGEPRVDPEDHRDKSIVAIPWRT